MYCFLFGLSYNDNYNTNNNVLNLRADIYKTIKNYDENVVYFLIKDFCDWKLDLSDIEQFLLQKQAALMLDYVFISRGFYWNSLKSQRFLINTSLISKIKNFTTLKPLLSIFLSYKNIYPKLLNPKLRVLKTKHVYDSNSFRHNKKLEWFFFLIPSVTVLKIIVPSLALLCETDTEVFDPDIYIKVQGSQWYWTYEILHDF